MSGSSKILIVEDKVEILDIYQELLEQQLKISPLRATNGKDAIKLLKKNKIKLIISDLNMPIMDGIELYLDVRNNGKDTPFIFLSNFSKNAKKRNIHFENVIFLEKPFSNEILINSIKQFLII